MTVEQFLPALSAFWANMFMIFITLSQKPLLGLMRGDHRFEQQMRSGLVVPVDGLATGARNMTGIGVATAAGIVVGAVSLAGVGLVMTELVIFNTQLSLIGPSRPLNLVLTVGSAAMANAIEEAPPNNSKRVWVEGMSLEGDEARKGVLLPLGPHGDAGTRMTHSGLVVMPDDDGLMVMAARHGSVAEKRGLIAVLQRRCAPRLPAGGVA